MCVGFDVYGHHMTLSHLTGQPNTLLNHGSVMKLSNTNVDVTKEEKVVTENKYPLFYSSKSKHYIHRGDIERPLIAYSVSS